MNINIRLKSLAIYALIIAVSFAIGRRVGQEEEKEEIRQKAETSLPLSDWMTKDAAIRTECETRNPPSPKNQPWLDLCIYDLMQENRKVVR